jgi:hypothetical protein
MWFVLFHLSKKFFDLHVVLTASIDMKHLTWFPFRKFLLFWCLRISCLGFLQQKYSSIITFYNRSSSGSFLTTFFYSFLSFIPQGLSGHWARCNRLEQVQRSWC